jgi:hypothetical protein
MHLKSLKLVLCSLFAGLVTIAVPGVAAAQRSGSMERIDTTLTLDRGGTLSVSVYSGRVNVVGITGSNVRIRGAVERGEMQLRSRSSAITVSTESEGPRGGRADLDITVPVGTRVVLEGFSAPFSIRGVRGEAKVESLSGGVQVTDAVGNVTIETVSGDIGVAGVDGNVRAEAVSGSVDIADVDGDIEGESVSGAFTMTGAKSKSVRVETVAGSVLYSGTFDPGGNYVFKSHSGRLTLGLPADAGATVSLETFSGNVDSDFPVTLESGNSRNGHESRFEFRIGNGRTRIVTETFSGDIRIQRSTNRDKRER